MSSSVRSARENGEMLLTTGELAGRGGNLLAFREDPISPLKSCALNVWPTHDVYRGSAECNNLPVLIPSKIPRRWVVNSLTSRCSPPLPHSGWPSVVQLICWVCGTHPAILARETARAHQISVPKLSETALGTGGGRRSSRACLHQELSLSLS